MYQLQQLYHLFLLWSPLPKFPVVPFLLVPLVSCTAKFCTDSEFEFYLIPGAKAEEDDDDMKELAAWAS
jgi:hypothetical protein